MQPPPRRGPPGASGGPPSGGPNMFRRTRPHKQTSAVPSTTQPMTDPFAFVRAPTPMAAGGFPTVPNSNPPPMPIPPSNFYSETGTGQPPQSLQDIPSTSTGSTTPSLPGVTLLNPSNTAPTGGFPAPAPPAYTEQSYFNSREQIPSMASEPAHEASAPVPNQTANNQEYHGPPPLFPLSHQPVPPVSASSQWTPDHGSRPPSVQNYFQPTNDPPTQAMNMQPYSQMFLPLTQSPHHNTHTPPTQSGQPSVQAPLQHPGRSQYIESNTPQQPNTHPPIQNYFSQSTNFSPLDSGYHQMGSVIGEAQPTFDSAPLSASSTGPRPVSAPDPHVLSQESGTLSMFFKDDVENEETLTGDANKAAIGITDSFPHLSSHLVSTQLHSGHAGEVFDFHGTPLQPFPQMPYLNDGSAAQGNNQKPTDPLYDHVENFECVPNQEVLPTERHTSPVSMATHAVDQFETGPNLETPDSAPRPMRSASVSSNYSNLSHGSGGTGTRRHQGVVGTFIQQESPRLSEDFSQSATGGYFEQIDSASAGDVTAHNATDKNWPPTPSPPKPVGTFQASANSSFEPVRSHSVGVRPAEVDRANMVVEGGADSTPGNLEQPPDNMENIYCLGPPLLTESPGSVPVLTHPVVHSHSRPSSRAYGVSRPCESPATTLWAQNDPSSLGTNIVLAPAAPTVLAPLRAPSSDVIQPPEDGPLDLHPSQRAQSDTNHHSENLENPPRVSETTEPLDSQGSLGYASLLVSDSLHQPILIAPPVSNYNVITASTPPQAGSQSGTRESGQLSTTVSQSQPPPNSSNQNPLFASSSNLSPLNLTRDKSEYVTSEVTTQPQPTCPPLSRSQSVVAESQPSVFNSPASLVTPVSNHNAPNNYELLDFSMHHSQTQHQASGHSSSLQDSQHFSNGFYLQVTKDAQQGVKAEADASVQTSISSSSKPVAPNNPEVNTQQPNHESTESTSPQASQHRQTNAPPVSEAYAPPSIGQYSSPTQGPTSDSVASAAYSQGPQGSVPPSPVPSGGSHPPSVPPRPPSTAGSQQGYGPPPAAPPAGSTGYRGYYAGTYGEYPDGRPYLPGQYQPPQVDTRSQYYPEDSYRNRADPWYGRYDGATQPYRDPNYQFREPQPERPSSRTSQYSDRPSSRQGYPEEYRANRGAYTDYYAEYPNNYNYAGYNYGAYDPRYRGYYDQSYWSAEGYRGREAYYNQQMYPARKNGYDDQWRYYPGYDPSFDDDYRWRGDALNDDFDRRSVHSEQSAHSVHSAHSNHSRQSSFSSRSQQSQVYRSQPDLVSAVYDNTSSTLAVDYSYGQYPNQTGASQNYSQYPYSSEYTTDTTWIAPEQPPPRPATPEKFTMPHRCARFGPGGHMVQVLPNLPSAGQPALVDIHNLETMLQDTSAQAELRAFPGPLVKEDTHKVDVIKFSQNKALECSRDNNLLDRDSARLLWDFIVLLCRQNGTVVGTDIADLLLKEHRSVWLPGKSPNEANLIDFNNEPLSRAEEEPGAGPLSLLSDTFMTVPENVGKETERFRELLLFGRKKDALEAAMKSGLWGHALLLASKMDSRTHARVMTRFANSLPINDPLQTVYQLMSGRMPASATCCGEEKWGDWRPHLAMVLSNLTHTLDLDTRTIATMGDTLASKGLVDAAHFCYLMAQVGLGVYTKKSTKMVLIGSNHSLSFCQFASNEAIQRTEAYEYAQSLGSHSCSLPNFQVYKLIYACRLAEAGLSAQAFHYCEVVAKTVLMQPSYYSPIFINQLIQMSEKLRFFDPQLKEKPEQELFREPEWLIHLRQLDGQMKTGIITYNADRSTPAQYDCSSPSSDLDEPSPPEPYSIPRELDGNTPDNPLMSSLLPGPPAQGVQLMPPAPTSILQDNTVQSQLLVPNEVPQFYPVPPAGPQGQMPFPGYPQQDSGYAPPPFQPQPEQVDMYPGPIQPPGGPPQVSQVPHHISPQMPPPSVLMPPSPAHAPPVEPLQAQPEVHTGQPISSSPLRGSLTPQMDFYDQMAHMGPGRRSRTTSQSSMHMTSGRRSRTTSESSTHSGGRERSSSAIKQVSPPPPPIPEQPRKEEKKAKRDSPKKSGGRGWLDWLYRKGKNEAHLPDDKNKSIVWDEKKQRWVDLNEPEEEVKPPPPPPSGFPNMPSMLGPAASISPPSGGPPVNMFSRKAGTKSRYVDVLNPSRTANKSGGLAPAPADIFAPLAPMTMPTNLFVPSSAPDDQQPLEGSEGGTQEQSAPNASIIPQMFNPTLVPPASEMPSVPDSSTSGELSRSSSMSSLSREVSQHLNQGYPPPGAMPTGGVPFYNPAQFTQPSVPSGGGQRSGRLGGQRQYPVMK